MSVCTVALLPQALARDTHGKGGSRPGPAQNRPPWSSCRWRAAGAAGCLPTTELPYNIRHLRGGDYKLPGGTRGPSGLAGSGGLSFLEDFLEEPVVGEGAWATWEGDSEQHYGILPSMVCRRFHHNPVP